MKADVLHTLLTAKLLFQQAQEKCLVEDKYTASAGLVILQDALELILYACLLERGVDEKKSLENMSFDQLIGELKQDGVRVIKSGIIKALNKQRVLIKHYGQVADPSTVRNYLEAARTAIDDILSIVCGKTLVQIMLHELIRNEEVRELLLKACEALEANDYVKVLVNVRKALFIEIEKDYCIYEWRDADPNEPSGLIAALSRGGWKAPWYKKKKDWIAENVHDPFDYVQIDHDRILLDLLEWGASTQDFWNIWRLTPQVIRLTKDGRWLIKGELKYFRQAANEENATYCLDRIITLLSKKQAHADFAKWIDYHPTTEIRVRAKQDTNLYKKASLSSEVVGKLAQDTVYMAQKMVAGLDGEGRFFSISHIQENEPRYLDGYVELDHCEILEEEQGI